MKRTIWIPVMIAALACVLAQTGCWKTDSNPTAPQITSEPLSKPLAQSVRFKLTFPASVKGSPRSLILGETSQIEPKAAIVASENTTPTVTFKLILINIGNASTPTTILSKTVPVDASGSAQTSFNSIPAQTVIGDIHIEGGHISGFSDFHGATDLLAQVENIVELSPKNSNTQPDVIATIIEQILSSELLFPKASTELASKIKTSLEGLDLSTSTIYEDALNQFVNQTMVQASNMTLATNSVVMDSTSMSSLSGLSSIMNEG
ncbi:hypothetical protein HYY75_11020, partial [bacterium]|nr:hypothetical protein [bacterium]